jgi:hypothetical protein
MTWSEFKSLIDTWNIKGLIRFTPKDANNNYQNIWVNFHGMVFEVTGFLSPGTDQTDFETNYMPTPALVWTPGMGINRNDVAFSFNASPSTATIFNYKLTQNTFLWDGAIIVQGSASLDGDYACVQIVDIDGLYYPANTVLESPINKKFITSTRFIDAGNPDGTPSIIPAGLYLVFSYTETQGVAKIIDVNLEIEQ